MWPQTWLPGRDLDFGPCSALLGHPGGLTQWRLSPGFAQRLLGRTQPPDPAWIGGGFITDPEGARARQWDLVAYRRAVVCQGARQSHLGHSPGGLRVSSLPSLSHCFFVSETSCHKIEKMDVLLSREGESGAVGPHCPLHLFIEVLLFKFSYLPLAVLGLRRGVRALSLCLGSLVAALGLLLAVTSLCRARPLGFTGFLVVPHRLRCPSACGILVP